MATENEAAKIGALARGLTLIRGNIGGIAVEVIVNFVLPYLIYSYLEHRQGEVMALIYSSGPPIAWTLIVLAWKREVDVISAFVVAGIALSLLAMLGGGSVKFLQLREKLVTVIFGLAFIVSAMIKRPLIYELARAGMKRNKSAELDRLETLRDDPRMRHFHDGDDHGLGRRTVDRCSGIFRARHDPDGETVCDCRTDRR